MSDEDQSQCLQVLKTGLDVIPKPGQAELPPVKLTHYLIISFSLIPLFMLFCPEINTIAAQEYNFLVLLHTLPKKMLLYLHEQVEERLFSVQWHCLYMTDVTLYSHFLEHNFSNFNVSTSSLEIVKRQIPTQELCLR